MSYILDALQRAEQERERSSGVVPGLQTRSIAPTTDTQMGGGVARTRWALNALVALVPLGIVVAIAAMGNFLWRAPPTVTPLALSPVAATPSAPSPVAAGPAAGLAVAVPVAATPVAMAAAIGSTTAPEPINVTPPGPSPGPVRAAPSKVQTPAPPSPKATLPFLKDLPEALRNQIPPLAISGVVYSENPTQRLLLINGQVLNQGSRAADDVVLDEIHPRSSDFTFQGTRFRVNH